MAGIVVQAVAVAAILAVLLRDSLCRPSAPDYGPPSCLRSMLVGQSWVTWSLVPAGALLLLMLLAARSVR